MLLILPHQAVELLVHLVFPLAVFESLDVLEDTGAQPVLFGLIALLALTLCLHLPVQELLGLQFFSFYCHQSSPSLPEHVYLCKS